MRSLSDFDSGGCEMNNLKTVIYAAVLGAICATLLAGVEQFTGPYKKANAQAERMRNVLEVLQVPFSEDSSPQKLAEIFAANVHEEKFGELPVYVYAAPGDKRQVKAIAVAFEGRGLWGPIRGFLSLKQDMRTIRGITFYEQEETPGLGGEIASSWFRGQFEDKQITGADGRGGIRIVKPGGARAENEVDAITGATMTCEKVEAMLNETIYKIVVVYLNDE
jgi:Na+-transporting NADH:ubiquinone oxidoreductase subunit C